MLLAAPGLAKHPPWAQWSLLVGFSVLFAFLLELTGLPAALLLGPMAAGILAGLNGSTLRVPRLSYIAAQGIVGCLIARAITPSILVSFMRDWPLFLAVVLATLAASSLLGWLISYWKALPGTTGIWGSSPGAATAMVVMAEAFGADVRLVAFMLYMRVLFVAVAASVIARLFIGNLPGAGRAAMVWFPPLDPAAFGPTLALAGVGAFLGWRIRIPAGSMLLPMAAGAALHSLGLLTIELPEWLLALTYAVLGWNIGLGFTRPVLAHAARALPQVVGSICALVAFCGGLAFLLSWMLGIDPLTAYLATSPGGMDSVAIIAASSRVDLPFVMTLQTVRFLLVMAIGPPLARFVARRMAAPKA